MSIWKLLCSNIAVAVVVTAGYAPEAGAKSKSSSPDAEIVAASSSAKPAESASGYSHPPESILTVMHAPSPPVPKVSPTNDSVLLVSWQDYPSIARVATPFLRLAGVRVEPKNHSKHDSPGGYGITPAASKFEIVRTADGAASALVG